MIALISLVLSLAAGALPFLLGTVYFMVADDYLINYIANGSYGWADSDHLIFLRMPIGKVLKMLYSLTTAVNWYFVMLVAVAVLSFAVLHACLYLRTRRAAAVALSAAAEYMAIAYFLSFTVVGFLSCGAGFALVFLPADGKRKQALHACAGVFLIYLGYCIRRNAFFAAGAVFLPLFLFETVGRLICRKDGGEAAGVRFFSAAYIVPALVLLLALCAGKVWEQKAYGGEGWKKYTTYNDIRAELVDIYAPPYEQIKNELKKTGFTGLDYTMLVNWKYCERSYFTEEKMAAASEVFKAGTTAENRRDYCASVWSPLLLLFLLTPFIIAAALRCAGQPGSTAAAVTTGIVSLFILAALAYVRMRFVIRVVFPIQLLASYASAFAAEPPAHPSRLKGARAVLSAVGGVLIAAGGAFFMKYYSERNNIPRTYYEEEPLAGLTQEIRANPDTLYVMDAATLSHQFYFGTPASRVMTTDIFKNVVRSGSWDSYSPRYYRQMEPYLENADDLLTAVVSEYNLRFVSMGGCEDLASFYTERFGGEVSYEGQAWPGRNITVWTLKEKVDDMTKTG